MASFFSCAVPHRTSAASEPFFAYQRRLSRYVLFMLVFDSLSLLSLSASYRPLPCASFPAVNPSSPLTGPPPRCRTVLFAPGPISQRQSWSLLCERLHRRSANTSFVRLRSERWPQANSPRHISLFPSFLLSSNLLNLLLPNSHPDLPRFGGLFE